MRIIHSCPKQQQTISLRIVMRNEMQWQTNMMDYIHRKHFEHTEAIHEVTLENHFKHICANKRNNSFCSIHLWEHQSDSPSQVLTSYVGCIISQYWIPSRHDHKDINTNVNVKRILSTLNICLLTIAKFVIEPYSRRETKWTKIIISRYIKKQGKW